MHAGAAKPRDAQNEGGSPCLSRLASSVTKIKQLMVYTGTDLTIKLTMCKTLYLFTFNPLSAKSDQHQFSPNNIHTLSRDENYEL